MIDINKQYTYNGKPVRIYADGSDCMHGMCHGAVIQEDGTWYAQAFEESDLVEVCEPKEERVNMTKEELLKRLVSLFDLTHGFTKLDFENILDEFFDSNVVIPRGKNRHIVMYADVLHKWIEGAELEFNRGDGTWHRFCIHDDHRIPYQTI